MMLPTDLVAQAIESVRPLLDHSIPVGDRLRNLWAAVVATRDLAACDIIEDEFMQLARDTQLLRDLGRHADNDIHHVIRWAMLDHNPFQ
jgi:hypothetical protein